jgi:hypothetical protein
MSAGSVSVVRIISLTGFAQIWILTQTAKKGDYKNLKNAQNK